MRVGFIGLGNAGQKLAGSLLRDGYRLTVHDIDSEAARPLIDQGAAWGDSGRQVAAACDAVITCLPSPAISAQVMEQPDGVLEGLGAGKVWLEMSTTEAADVQRLGALVEARGAMPLDAPVSGGCHRAATGNITIFAGGTRGTFEKALPLLTSMGREVVHTGALGSASILKVVSNYLAAAQLISTGEAFMVAKKAGIDLAVAYEAIRVSSGNSYVHETEGKLVLNGSYHSNFTMDHQLKDVTLFEELAKSQGLSLELSPLCVEIMRDGVNRYGPRVWSSMVVKRLEDDSAEDLRADGFPEVLVDHEPQGPGAEVKVDRAPEKT